MSRQVCAARFTLSPTRSVPLQSSHGILSLLHPQHCLMEAANPAQPICPKPAAHRALGHDDSRALQVVLGPACPPNHLQAGAPVVLLVPGCTAVSFGGPAPRGLDHHLQAPRLLSLRSGGGHNMSSEPQSWRWPSSCVSPSAEGKFLQVQRCSMVVRLPASASACSTASAQLRGSWELRHEHAPSKHVQRRCYLSWAQSS